MSDKEIVTPELSKPETLKNFAVELKAFIVKQGLYTNIVGKNYVHVEGWAFAGGSLGLVALVNSCEKLERVEEVAYRSEVHIMKGDTLVSRGFAVCSNKEVKKKNFDEYAIMSMSQTRAVGKAYRLLLGWLMKMAGYEGTPSEEMDESYVDVEPRGTDSVTYCQDCGKEMALYVKGDKKGQLHCKGKNAMPGETPMCPPREMTDWEKKVSKELDNTPVPENMKEHKTDCDCDKCIPVVEV